MSAGPGLRLAPLLAWLGPLLVSLGLWLPPSAAAAPGLCVGPICADQIERSSTYPWQRRLRLSDQRGQHERVVIDCRDGQLSPADGPVERGYGGAVARRACRLS
ncbi:MAG: hypothetical protein VKK62_09115 [Synechococcaceae cyanobacterium]|nr:hypothetical protein [Synechococcaceae cyanobacterium]